MLARPRAAVTVALLVCACALASATPTLAATPLPQESLVIFEGQLNGHQVTAVTVHTKTHTFHISLKDGRRISIAFPASQQQRLEGDIRAQGIAVQVAKVQPPPSHKLRYIVGAIVIVLIVLAIVGLLYMRRRRTREDEQGPGYR
jgi:ATP-dependent Zn protease